MAYNLLHMALIPLTRDRFAKVSACDYSWASERPWNAVVTDHTCYAQHYVIGPMHRAILERKLGRALEKGELPDHKNGDGLDNRRGNLRVATLRQNSLNRGRRRNGSSLYKGVSWHKPSGSWEVRIACGKDRRHLGYFHDQKVAGRAYDAAAKVMHKRFARLNFP